MDANNLSVLEEPSVILVQSVNQTPNVQSQSGREDQSAQKVQSGRSIKAKPFSTKKHRRGKRNSVKLFTKPFKWLGNNIAGAKSKWSSVKRWICMKNPSILSLQETKFKTAGKHNLDGYYTYEHLRTKKQLAEVF